MNSRIRWVFCWLILSVLAEGTAVAAQEPRLSLPSLTIPGIPQRQGTAKPIVVEELIEQLRTAKSGQRWEIIQKLSDTQQNIVPALVKALDDPDPLVKSGVAEVLGNLTDQAVSAIPKLVEMISDERRAIVPASFTESYVPSLRIPFSLPPINGVRQRRTPPEAPRNPENRLRITAIAALGKIGLPARTLATPPLTQALQDPDPWVRLNATWALAEIGASQPLLSHWLEAFQNPDPILRQSAAAVFADSNSLLRKVFGAEATASTIPPLLNGLKDEDFTVREAASDGLKLLGSQALPELIPALKAPEPLVRLEVAKLLGDLASAAQPAVPDLVALLDDPDRYVPPASTFSTLFSIPPLPAPILGSGAYLPPPPGNSENLVRVNAAIALGEIGDRSAVPTLTKALKDDNPWMQLATSWALLKMGQMQGLPVVGQLVQSSNSSVRQAALSQLEGYGPKAIPYLLPYYSIQLDSANDNERNGAIIRLGKLGPAALDVVPKLRSLLVSTQRHSSGYAATILGEIARDTAMAWQNGSLSANQRQQAIAELTKVLNIMQAPNARFNREPIDRVRSALTTLRGRTP